MDDKLKLLKTCIREYKSAVIAFSGGVDSTFLARVAKDVLGDNLLLITATSSTYPFYELEEAKSLATAEFEVSNLGFTQFRIRSHENIARFEFIMAEMDKA